MKNKIIDCVTFFDNNFIFELRYNILKKYVDCFIVCSQSLIIEITKKMLILNLRLLR